jgi:uncharacterized SAM-binding protein YcdF (DUF218 family)
MTDTIRMVFTYLIALVIVVGGGVFLFETRADQAAQSTQLVVSGFIGAAIAFVFGQETSTRSARQSVTSSESGAVLHANGIANVANAATIAASLPPK